MRPSASARRVGRVRHLEGVEADAAHEGDLVGQHVADGAQLAREAVLLAQQARGGEGAAVGELGEVERDQGEAGEVGGDVVDAPRRRSSSRPSGASRPASASRSASQRFLDRIDGRVGQRLAIGRSHPGVAPEGAVAPDRAVGSRSPRRAAGASPARVGSDARGDRDVGGALPVTPIPLRRTRGEGASLKRRHRAPP